MSCTLYPFHTVTDRNVGSDVLKCKDRMTLLLSVTKDCNGIKYIKLVNVISPTEFIVLNFKFSFLSVGLEGKRLQ